MLKPRLHPPQETARILGISRATVRNWIYAGKLRTVKTAGGHHRILEEDIQKLLRSRMAAESHKKRKLGSFKISEGNLLIGRILEIKLEGLMAQVRLFVEGQQLDCLVTADLAAELRLKIGNTVVVLFKASQITVLRGPV